MNKCLIYQLHAIGLKRISKFTNADIEALAVSFNATPEEVEAEITEMKTDPEKHWEKATTPEEPASEVIPEGGGDEN